MNPNKLHNLSHWKNLLLEGYADVRPADTVKNVNLSKFAWDDIENILGMYEEATHGGWDLYSGIYSSLKDGRYFHLSWDADTTFECTCIYLANSKEEIERFSMDDLVRKFLKIVLDKTETRK